MEKMAEVAETMLIPIELATMAEFPFVSISEDFLVFVPDLSSVDVVAGNSDSGVLLWRSKYIVGKSGSKIVIFQFFVGLPEFKF